ncbi:MAG: mechanosensitive ion channel family protein [Prolixibacteraceae bacterium]|jgi:small conductance mechanosensitive channel|nr:mechanosensitive ion channel family protein [Prolixibacteraceae bacterium]MBT6006231.1 mechanosensitive ion channel family protein [Prolixibacteraceae bacterium]MBT6764271.1 mechanosensitive ion channel family protein [Prolixibacteraceae bacterium]MBT6999053.1 mechanosensitive ion channel family protein [Prolixibacteraceae bacterium]MBT7394448.1 mechanosensitive ion channel family protein [Prolixibacteraceae bacterium]
MKWEDIKYIVLILAVLIAAFVLSTVLRKLLNLFIKRNAKRWHTDPTNFSFLKNSASFIVYTIAIVYIFLTVPFLKNINTAVFTGAGIAAAAIGFASQKALSNIISGIFILIFKPFRVEDIIEINSSNKGIVEEVTLRHTIIKDFENRRIVVPNSVISDATIVNSSITDEKIRKQLDIGISYDSDIDKAIGIIQEEAEKHPFFLDGRSDDEKKNNDAKVIVRVVELGDFAVTLRAYIWSMGNNNAFVLKCDLLKFLKQRFDKEGIEIPFPYRTVVYKKDIQNEKMDEK